MARYTGGIISKTGITPTGGSASGIWSLSDYTRFKKAGTWPGQALYAFTNATFTPGSKTGRNGPSLTEARTGLTGTGVDVWKNNTGYFNTSNGIQLWVVPETGVYRIIACGASGYTRAGTIFSQAAKMQGDFSLIAGSTIKILVGQRPLILGGNGGGAGGGSFVVTNSNTPLIVAGGGGGAGYEEGTAFSGSIHASVLENPTGTGWNGNGTGGGSGITSPGGCGSNGTGGGGFNSDAILVDPTYQSASALSKGFINGGVGGITNDPTICVTANEGGFGGGGGAGNTGSGGGGYSGGNAGRYYGTYYSGNGGGSYNAGSNPSNTTQNSADGFVTITKVV